VASVSEARPVRGVNGLAMAFTLASSVVMLLSPWFILQEVEPALSLGGEPYLSARTGPGMLFAGLQTAVAVTWCAITLNRSLELSRREKQIFGGVLGLYAAMGVSSLLHALDLTAHEGVLEYGPLVVSLGAGRVLAVRQRRLETQVQEQIEARASELRESESRYREVLENAPIGFLSVDGMGKLEHANAALLGMLGSTRAEFEASFDVMAEESAKRSGFSTMLEHAMRTGEVLSDEFAFDSWWGRRLTTRVSVAPRRLASGATAGALAIIEDVTERRAIERQLQRAQRMEAVGQLAAGIAHEINNPMAYVRSNLTVLGEDLDALAKEVRERDPAAAALTEVARLGELRERSLAKVQRTVNIVRDLREFSHAGQAQREPVDVNALLENAARLVSARSDGQREIALHAAASSRVVAAPGQLRQVFLNLLVHALQGAGSRGRVSATTSSTHGEVLVAVSDDGAPIAAEERARLFEPFAATRGGVGEPSLGLYISQQIVREHGGRIEVLSTERGTSLVVRLPAAAEENAPAE
jgi:PAS domain S-box-containing protein